MRLIMPLIYVSFIFPMTAIAVGTEVSARTIGILGDYRGVIDLPLFIVFLSSIILVGVPLFWLANVLLRKLEKLNNPILPDHFRQSIFFYLILMYCSGKWFFRGFSNTEENAYLLMWMGISLVGIAINYIFLFRRRKTIVI